MKNDIHPKYTEFKANCSCGNVIVTRSTIGKDIHLDVCSACHPFYTGKQKSAETGGRVDKFNKRFAAMGKKQILLTSSKGKKAPIGAFFVSAK